MAEFIEFTDNYDDQSTDRGFQWEFHCQRCGNGYRSQFRRPPPALPAARWTWLETFWVASSAAPPD